jgi:hypothetical protein
VRNDTDKRLTCIGYYDPRTGGVIHVKSAVWWNDPDALVSGLPAKSWNDIRLMIIIKSLGQFIGRLKDEEKLRGENVASPLRIFIGSLDAVQGESIIKLQNAGWDHC